MKRIQFAVMSLAIALPQAQQPSTTTTAPTSTGSDSQTAFNALPGRWVRVEGGYVITIRAVDADGRLDASYANPSPLPFYSAQAILRAAGWWIRWVNLHTKIRCDERQAHGRLQPSRCKAEVRGDLRPCKAPIIANNVSIDRAPFRG